MLALLLACLPSIEAPEPLVLEGPGQRYSIGPAPTVYEGDCGDPLAHLTPSALVLAAHVQMADGTWLTSSWLAVPSGAEVRGCIGAPINSPWRLVAWE